MNDYKGLARLSGNERLELVLIGSHDKTELYAKDSQQGLVENGTMGGNLWGNCNTWSLEKSENFTGIEAGFDRNVGTTSTYMAIDGLFCVEVIF